MTEVLVAELKPRLRGWLHAGTFPLALAVAVVLVALADDGRERVAAVLFGLTSTLLFGVSAIYHRGHWSPQVRALLRRLDHSNIFLIIAGTYTPFGLLLPPDADGALLLELVWVGAIAGVAFRVLWTGAPRWLYVPVYIALGWAAVFWLPALLSAFGVAVVALIVAGGLCYSAGGVVYALKRPDPSPRWFGFHEVFHSLTLAGYACHCVAVALVLLPR